jgi:hypothetical protein
MQAVTVLKKESYYLRDLMIYIKVALIDCVRLSFQINEIMISP